MLKLAGSLLVIIASVGFGVCLCRDMTEHLRLLYIIRKMLVDISYAAASSMQPVEILLGCFVRTKEERLDAALKKIAEELIEKQEENGEEVWKKVFLAYRRELHLTEEEMDILAGAGSAFFGKSMEENQRRLELTLERLDFLIETTRSGQKEKQKVCQTVSVISGLMLVLLLL